jgi:DNA-binding NtrC family response regulator
VSSVTLTEDYEEVLGQVRFLTYVLCYDDLLSAATASISLHDVVRPIVLRRAPGYGPPRFDRPSQLDVPDRWMSSDHALIERRGGEDWLRDLGSRNGTYVNGSRVTEHHLADGDLIEMGHSLLCYRVVDAALARRLGAPEAQLRLGPTRTFCPEVAGLLAELRSVAPSRESILLLGETGVGKEIAAHAVHAMSGRSGSYRPVDCGAIPESHFESTFYGHETGAYTGALADRIGEIARSDGGTLFIDEVGNLGLACQAKLLRVVEEQRVTPLGARDGVQVNVRWVAATNRDLFLPDAGFRPDLLRRLASHVARLPPLRKRREDLGVLSAHLLAEANVARASISAAAGRRLFTSGFPGNIRQLRATLRRATLLAGEGPIQLSHIDVDHDRLAGDAGERAPDSHTTPPGPAGLATPPSREKLEAALVSTRGNVVRAAKLLSAHPRQVYRWIDRHALDLEKLRGPGTD